MTEAIPAPTPEAVAKAQVVLKNVIDVATPQLLDLITAAKTNFLTAFGNWVESAHRERLEELFVDAAQAKIGVLTAPTLRLAREQQDIYETAIASMETLGLAIWITAKAEAVAALKATVNQVLQVLAAAAGMLIKVAIEAALPGAGALIGPAIGAGVTYVIDDLIKPSAPKAT